MDLFKRFKTEWYEPLIKIAEGGSVVDNYALLPKGPLEEVTSQVERLGEAVVMEFPFEIWDFGTWESVALYQEKMGEYKNPSGMIEIEAKNNFVRVGEGKTVALVGVEDLVVIDRGDALMICKRDKTGMVGQVVDRLKEEGREELL